MRSSAALAALPAAATAINVTQSAGAAWSNGSWTEIAAAAPANAVLAGIVVFNGNFNQAEREVQIGIGASGSEAAIATFRMGLPSSGNGRSQAYMLPIPISGLSSQRVSARIRTDDAGGDTLKVAVLYLDNPSADVCTSSVFTCVPAAATGVSVTPSGTGWAYSSWVELTSGIGVPIGIAGLAHTTSDTASSFEFEIGTGGAGSEAGITTLRGTNAAGSLQPYESWMLLNGIYTLAASTRIAVRMRKTGTGTTAYKVALLYYSDLTISGGGGGPEFPALTVAI